MYSLSDKVILITGAGKGTGRTLAEALAGAGARVAANDLTPVNLDETAARISAKSGGVRTYLVDVTRQMPVQGLVQAVLDDWGHIDGLVCCAEVEPVRALLEMDAWDWQRTLDVNLTAAFLLVQAVGRAMIRRGRGGTIVLVGERAQGPDGRAAYFASKAGLESLARTAAAELTPSGIRVLFLDPAEAGEAGKTILSLFSKEEEDVDSQEYLFSGFRKAPGELAQVMAPIADAFIPIKDDGWNLHQIVTHMHDTNAQVYLPRLKRILESPNPTFEDFDGEAWMQNNYDPLVPIKELVEDFTGQCRDVANLLEQVTDDEWDRPGTHLTLGTHSLAWWADRMLAHIREHLAQIREE
ncbi:MAG: SDR family NAD(P)-dependent oxidoreductase [Anaerolineales bacterium]|nr:SDR family NAD(P)-dependent oxidoreductase [Anaerolineales bacterium]